MQLDPDQLADIVATAIKSATAPLLARIVQLERKESVPAKDGRDGQTIIGPMGPTGPKGDRGDQGASGKDADETVLLTLQEDVKALRQDLLLAKQIAPDTDVLKGWVMAEVAALQSAVKAPESRPVCDFCPHPAHVGKQCSWEIAMGADCPCDLRQMTTGAIKAAIAGEVRDAVAALPRPKDGLSVTVEDVVPVIASEVQKAVAALPAAKDGVGVAGAVIDRDGRLVLTLSDGATKELGAVVGKDVDQAAVAALILAEVAKIARPKDGADGLGFDEMEPVYDEHGRLLLRFVRGDRVKEFRVPGIVDRGVYKSGERYLKGDGATFGGSFFIAQEETSDKPETSSAWRLAVKHGREGKPGPSGEKGLDGKPGRDGKDGQWR
jgi:hypothetical protein